MKINQLFRHVIEPDLVERYVHCIGLTGTDDAKEFTKHHLAELNAGQRILDLMGHDLANAYLPCKRLAYFDRLPESKVVVVILRQLLKAINSPVFLQSREKNSAERKVFVYRLARADRPCCSTMKWVQAPVVIYFPA